LASFGGELLAKEGAEGFYAMALAPALCTELTDALRVTDDCAIGIAIKVDDGSMDRGRNPVILRVLSRLGIDLDARPELQPWRETRLRNYAGTVVGEVRSEFDLEVL
jgi:L-asparaginase II